MRRLSQPLLALAVVFAGLAGRAVIDKILTLQGGPAVVAAWAQVSSLSEVVSGVSLAGFGVALMVKIASSSEDLRVAWMREALTLSLLMSGIAALVGAPIAHLFGYLVLDEQHRSLSVLALVAGWFGLAPTLAALALVSVRRPGAAALVTAASFLPPIAALLLMPTAASLSNLLAGQIATGAIAILSIYLLPKGASVSMADRRKLLRFAPAGLTIGILSPVATVIARSGIAGGMSWADVGMVQAIWRANEWTTLIAAGLLNAYYLPRFASAAGTPSFAAVLRRSAATILPAAALMMLMLWILLPQALNLLYRSDLVPLRMDAVAFFVGDWLRIVSWIALYGLYAQEAPRAVSIGEFLSLPLFAVLIVAMPGPFDIREVGMAWALAYLSYAVFNGLALREAVAARERIIPVTNQPKEISTP